MEPFLDAYDLANHFDFNVSNLDVWKYYQASVEEYLYSSKSF